VFITTMILVVGSLLMMLFTWIERRGIAFMQDRKGPNRVGPFGLLQPVAEAIKTMTKEDITPTGADRWVHFLAPVVLMFSTIMVFAAIPWGNLMTPFADSNVALLFAIAIGALHTMGMLMAGWGSNNKFALLGGMRAAAQMISYEIPQVLSLVAIVLMVGSMSMKDIVGAQVGGFGFAWFIFTPVGLLSFIIFWISSLAEGERTPFDIPEAESELVAGYMTEYGGMKFALFFLANYMTNLAICAIARRRGLVTLIDNTWATPLFFPAIAAGVDLSILACTKYVVGHSDAMLGSVTSNPDRMKALDQTARALGQAAGPDDVWLGLRGLRTLGVRLRHHQASALTVARWLAGQPQVARVLHPALASCPGHALWSRDFSGASGLFSFVLNGGDAPARARLIDSLELFGIGYSWGGFESLALPVDPQPIRTATSCAFEGPLVRLHIGLEDPADLLHDLSAALARYPSQS